MVREYGYEYDAVLNEELARTTQGQCVKHIDHGAILLRSGRDALKTVAREYSDAVVLLPALACDSMILPFKLYGHEVVYYRLRQDYSVDYEALCLLLSKQVKQVLLLYMSYFGNPSFVDKQLEWIKQQYPNAVFIEDRTHDLIYARYNKFEPDYTVASLRKWMNVPDGGLLWANIKIKITAFSEDTSFSQKRRSAQCMRHNFFLNGDETVKTVYRRIFSTVTDQIDADPLPARMSSYAYEMALAENWDRIRRIREENATALIGVLDKSEYIKFIQSDTQRSNLYVPILIEERDKIQSKLSAKGIFTTLIWPINDEQRNCCSVAMNTEAHMLGIPCDQRYNVQDMHFIGNEILKTICE